MGGFKTYCDDRSLVEYEKHGVSAVSATIIIVYD
jgi:hypothetical protein